jgi:hypothetical protein
VIGFFVHEKIVGYLKENDKIISDFILIISKESLAYFFRSDAKLFSP